LNGEEEAAATGKEAGKGEGRDLGAVDRQP